MADFLAPLTSPLAVLLQSSGRVTKDYFEYREVIEVKAAGLAPELPPNKGRQDPGRRERVIHRRTRRFSLARARSGGGDLLASEGDALYVADVLAAWAGRYIGRQVEEHKQPQSRPARSK